MNSRLERYNEVETNDNVPSRLERNQQIYSDLNKSELLNIRTGSNVKVIDESSREINMEKIKKYVLSLNEETPRKKIMVTQEETSSVEESKPHEEKVYDINSVLEKAKQGREHDYEQNRYRKLRDTQYDILSKIKMYDSEEKPKYEEEFNTDERTLIDLINTVTIQKEKDSLLSELVGTDDNTEVTSGIDDESKNSDIKELIEKKSLEKEKVLEPSIQQGSASEIDKSFYTNSTSFSKDDFEVFEELEKTVKKNNSIVKIGVALLIILGLATIVVVLKYVLNIELF